MKLFTCKSLSEKGSDPLEMSRFHWVVGLAEEGLTPFRTGSKSSRRSSARRSVHRRGTTIVEVAMILPIFFTFIFGIIEFGRLQLVSNMLKTACRSAGRLGSTENVTTAQATDRVRDILSAVLDTNKLTVVVKNAGVYDTDGPYPSSAADYNALPNLELNDAEPRSFFLIRASIAYNDIALMPFSVLNGIELSAQSLMRHE